MVEFSKRGDNPGKRPGGRVILTGAIGAMSGAMFRRCVRCRPTAPGDSAVRPTGGYPLPGGRAAVLLGPVSHLECGINSRFEEARVIDLGQIAKPVAPPGGWVAWATDSGQNCVGNRLLVGTATARRKSESSRRRDAPNKVVYVNYIVGTKSGIN